MAANGNGPVKLRLALEWFWNPDHLPFVVAEQKGYFAKRGLEVEVIEPSEHFEAFDKIRDGEIDVAVTETLHLVQDRAKFGPGKIVGFSRFFNTIGGVMFKKEVDGVKIERPRDLEKLKEIRLTYPGAPGNGGPAILRTMVESDGGNATNMKFTPVHGGFFHTKTMKEGKADFGTLVFCNFELPEAKAANLDVDYFDLKMHGVPDFCQLILFTTGDVLAKKSGALRQLNLAIREAVDFIKLNQKEARKLWYEKFPPAAEDTGGAEGSQAMMDEILDLTLPMFPASQDLSKEYWDNLRMWFERTEQIEPGKCEPFDYWTNELLF